MHETKPSVQSPKVFFEERDIEVNKIVFCEQNKLVHSFKQKGIKEKKQSGNMSRTIF